jgi:hypothetical protein
MSGKERAVLIGSKSHVRGVRLGRSVKKSQVESLPPKLRNRRKLAAQSDNAAESGFVKAGRMEVDRVVTGGGFAEIGYPVILGVPVDMIDKAGRPASMDIQPCEPMGLETITLTDADRDIP